MVGDGEIVLVLVCSEKFELIFLDIVMLGMNGFVVLCMLCCEFDMYGIFIVMISGNL